MRSLDHVFMACPTRPIHAYLASKFPKNRRKSDAPSVSLYVHE